MSEPTPFAWLRKSSLVKRIRSISSCRCWTCKGTQETKVSSTSRCLYRAEQSAWVIWQDMTRYSITFCRKLIIARLDRGCTPMVARQNKSSKGLMDSVISVPVAMDPLIRTLPGSCRTLDFCILKHCSKWQKDAFQPWIARRRAALTQRFSGQILIGILRLESARLTKSARERVTDPQTTT